MHYFVIYIMLRIVYFLFLFMLYIIILNRIHLLLRLLYFYSLYSHTTRRFSKQKAQEQPCAIPAVGDMKLERTAPV